MKSQTLPIKRRPVSHGMFRRLSAKTQRRHKQKAAAAGTAGQFDHDDGGSKVSWALTIVFLIHIVALCLIFIHHHFISGRPLEQSALPENRAAVVGEAVPVVVKSTPQVVDAQLSAGLTPYIVRTGDNYVSIAKAHDVAEADLRSLNGNVGIRPGYILKIPVKRVVVKAPARVAEPSAAPVKTESRPVRDQGLVKAIDIENVPRAKLVSMDAAKGTYVVQPNDSIWGIAKRFGVGQEELMELNGIKDVRKLHVGMTLKLPSSSN